MWELERGTWAAAALAQPCRVLRPPLPELFSLPDFPKWRGQDTWVPKREVIQAGVKKTLESARPGVGRTP